MVSAGLKSSYYSPSKSLLVLYATALDKDISG